MSRCTILTNTPKLRAVIAMAKQPLRANNVSKVDDILILDFTALTEAVFIFLILKSAWLPKHKARITNIQLLISAPKQAILIN